MCFGDWGVAVLGRERHIIPVNDVWEHDPIGYRCWCRPYREDINLIVHHSLDGREAYEIGLRKVN